jgi:hypothetical protein
MNSFKLMKTMTAAVVVPTLEVLIDSQPCHLPNAATERIRDANKVESND